MSKDVRKVGGVRKTAYQEPVYSQLF